MKLKFFTSVKKGLNSIDYQIGIGIASILALAREYYKDMEMGKSLPPAPDSTPAPNENCFGF